MYIKKAKTESKNIYKCIKIKLYIFIIVGFIILFFSWYYLSAFCSVYKNSQIHLIKNIFASFILSMFYPMALSLIPTTLRIISLRDKQKNKYCLYQTSKLIALI